ncbi:hypothetical protein [Paraburkholderia sp.]|uniref:hypothetical protein n=1 Tax=Paraburkholderia sp. TaxID=1926495 RepID=UPI003D6F7CB6
MTAPERLNDEARCDLLCHLVVVQLIEHTRSGAWLRAAQIAESTRLWLGADRTHTTRTEQATLARTASALAPVFLQQPAFRDTATLARLSFDIWRMNFAAPLLRTLRAACATRLAQRRNTKSPTPSADGNDLDNAAAKPEPHTVDQTTHYATCSACAEGRALIVTVGAIRRAQGKKNPQDMPMHSPEWPVVHEAFVRDLLHARRSPLDTGSTGTL